MFPVPKAPDIFSKQHARVICGIENRKEDLAPRNISDYYKQTLTMLYEKRHSVGVHVFPY